MQTRMIRRILHVAVTGALVGGMTSVLAGNTVTGTHAVVAGGDQNTASGNYSSVGGGQDHVASGGWSTIAGGDTNSAEGSAAAVGGGAANDAGGVYATVSGGDGNHAYGAISTIGGGESNRVDGDFAAIGGGYDNYAAGTGAVIPGGEYNLAHGYFSFAGGLNAHVRSSIDGGASVTGDIGTFVWADATGWSNSNLQGTEFESTGSNQFLVRANGGFGLNDTPPSKNIAMTIASTASNDNRAQVYLHQHTSNNGVLLIGGDATTGSNSSANDASFYIDQYNGSNQTRRFTLDASGNLKVTAQAYKPGGGSWAASSDARLKKNVQPLGNALDRLLALRGVTFEYARHDDAMHPAGTFTGFIAQEVQRTFPDWIGHDADGYLTVGPQGFEALTVEALRELKRADEARIAKLESDNAALRAELAGQIKAQAAGLAALREQLAALAGGVESRRLAAGTTPAHEGSYGAGD